MEKRTKDSLAVERFLRGCFLRGACERVELRQISQQGTHRVLEWVIQEMAEIERSPEAFAEVIDEMAGEDAQVMRGPTRYGVFVFRTGEAEHFARVLFVKRGEMSDNGTFAETEEPDKTGLTSMAMRHAEASTRFMHQGMSLMFGHFERIIDKQNKRIEDSDSRYIEVLELHEKLSSGVEERRLSARKAEREEAIKERILDQTQMLLPAFMGKLLPAGQKDTVIVDGIRQFMKSLRPEQLEKLIEPLDEAQQMSMLQLYQALLAEEEAKEKVKQQVEAEVK